MTSSSAIFYQMINGDITKTDASISKEKLEVIINNAEESRSISKIPAHRAIIDFFSKLHNAWSAPDYGPRVDAAQLLRNQGMGANVIAMFLDRLPSLFAPERILKKLEGELGHPEAMERPVLHPATGASIISSPAGLVLHVVAGNVSISAIESLVDGIITKNTNFLKMSSEDRYFPIIFARSMRDCDPANEICSRISILWWPGGESAVEMLFKQTMDRIVFWGGYDALIHWKRDLGAKTVLIQHGPKVSVGVMSRRGLQTANIADVAERLAFDISIWDQKACNCPQVLYIEADSPADQINLFFKALEKSLDNFIVAMEPSRRSDDDHVEVLRFRELAFAKSGMTKAKISVSGPRDLGWTIIYEEKSLDFRLDLSPLSRTIIVRHYFSLQELSKILKGQSFYMQTFGYWLAPEEIVSHAMAFSDMGATRICRFGTMAMPNPGLSHDGTFALRDLTRAVSLEMGTDTAY